VKEFLEWVRKKLGELFVPDPEPQAVAAYGSLYVKGADGTWLRLGKVTDFVV
jgi:hypothetical protein